MKRSSTSESVKHVVECEEKASISSNSITISSQTDTNKSVENLIKSVNKLSIDFQVVDYSSIKGPTSPTTPKAVDLSACRHKSVSDEKVNLASSLDVVDPHHLKSKSMTAIASCVTCGSGDTLDEPKRLISPYGDWCAFSGGAGSGGCIFTGPYEPMIVPKGDWSDESFESTEESDATVDFCETAGYTHNNFQNTEVVWAKRPGLPWFPGIIIDPHSMCNKDVKAIIKDVGSSLPNKDQLCDFTAAVINTRQTDKLFLVNLFNRKRTWIWLAESKLRPFCKENDKLFLDHSEILHSSYKKELAKAYKKGKKYYIDGEEHVIARKLVHRHHHLFF